MSKSELEEEFYKQLKEKGMRPRREYRFCPFRRWRADFGWPGKKVLVEIQGGAWARRGAKRCPLCREMPKGRHSSIEKDCEKISTAASLGYRVFLFTAKHIKNGWAIETIEKVIGS